jgi:hypothetical protein
MSIKVSPKTDLSFVRYRGTHSKSSGTEKNFKGSSLASNVQALKLQLKDATETTDIYRRNETREY